MGQSGTAVTGIINSNITWTKTNSPYYLAGNILVNNGVTLTIEPDVTVNLGSYYIQVNGTLVAKGSYAEQISFVGGSNGPLNYAISFTPAGNSWNEKNGAGSIIENANFRVASIVIDNVSPKINNDSLSSVANSAISILSGSPIISNNTILSEGSGILIDGGSPVISNNTLTCKSEGIFTNGANLAIISDNVIMGCDVGIELHSAVSSIEENLITKNGDGLDIYEAGDGYLQNNTIVNNDVGINLKGDASMVIWYNNIEQNNQYNFYSEAKHSLVVLNNWWGTTNTQAINQSIYDFKNDFNLGSVYFVPFLNVSNSHAPTIPISNPTPSNSPTLLTTFPPNSPIPSDVLTSTPTQTTSSFSSASPSSQPVPFQFTVAIFVIVIIVVAVGAFLLGRRTGRSGIR
jgi:parallel beta-helix repeat protein